MGKLFHFAQSTYRHVTSQNWSLSKYQPCSDGFNTHLWWHAKKFQRLENVHFWTKCRHEWQLIVDCVVKMNPLLRVSTQIFVDSKEIDWIMFICQSKCRHVTPLIDCPSKNEALFWGISTQSFGGSKEIDSKTCWFLRVNAGMWPLKLIVLQKEDLSWMFQHIFLAFPRR